MGAIPETIGPFRLLSVLGRGGMGVVYRAAHVESGEVVALKTVLTPRAAEAARIRDEIQALSSIDHPGVVRIRAVGLAAGLPWYAMELLDGRTLAAWIHDLWEPYRALRAPSDEVSTSLVDDSPAWSAETRDADTTVSLAVAAPAPAPAVAPGEAARGAARERPPAAAGRLGEVLSLACRLCAPLAFIHGEGLVHRDLKPSNVFVLEGGAPVLMDFGVVSRAHGTIGREALEAAGILVGTAAYVAPEQVRGRRVDARADLYALGCTLYEMVTGETPFAGSTVSWILQAHLTAAPRPPSEVVSGVPPALDALILGLLAKDLGARIGYADDVAAVLSGLGAAAAAPPARKARSYLYRPETVGRAAIVGELSVHLEAARAGRGSFVALHGESGIGKTVVLAELAREAVTRGMEVVIGECVAAGLSRRSELDAAGTELGPIRPLLRAVAGAAIGGGPEVAGRLFWGARARLLAGYEPAILGVPGYADHPAPPDLPPEAARERLFAALRDTLAAFAAEGPVLLVIDDLQWADDLSRSFLGSLTADDLAGRRLAVVTAHRAEETGEALRALVAAPQVRALGIDRLDEEAVAAIVGQMLAMAAPPLPFVRFLARHSEGNPFFVAEYLRAAVEEGHLRRRGGAWHLSDAGDDPHGLTAYEALPLPRSLRDLVRVRLDALSGPARDLAEIGSVIGRELSGDLLARASSLEGDDVRARIRELRARHVLEPAGDGRHRFVHDKIREVAYDAIPEVRRRALHLAVGRALEGASGEADQARAAELGHHFQHAGELERAVDHLEQAGELALDKLAHEEAKRHFEEAIALEPRLRERAPALRRARWHTWIAEAEHALGRPARGRVHAERAAALLGMPVPSARPLVALDALGELALQAAHLAFPGLLALRASQSDEALQQAARTYHILMKLGFLGAPPLAVVHATLRSLNLAERAGPSPTLANAYAASSCTAAMLSLSALSRAYSRRAHATLDRAEDGPARSFALAMDALSHLVRAEWREMYGAAEAGAAIAARHGFVRRHDEIQTTLAWAELVRGDLSAAEARYAAMRAGPRRGGTQADLWIRVGLAAVHAERDRLGEALEEIRVPEERFGGGAQRTEQLGVESLRALLHQRRGDRDAARRDASRALAMIREGPPSAVSLPSHERVAEVFAELRPGASSARERAELEEASRAACAALARGARLLPIWRPAAHLAAGRHAWCEGREARARSRWEACLATARALEMPYHAALARLALGQHGPEAARGEHLAAALSTFTAAGAAYRKRVALAPAQSSTSGITTVSEPEA